MRYKVYAHLEDENRPLFSLPVEFEKPENLQFGTVKQMLLARFAAQYPEQAPIEYGEYCFWNQDRCPIADRASLALFAWEHNDFFLRPLPDGANKQGTSGALAASQSKRGDLSYYYAHDRGSSALISKPQTIEAPAAAIPREPIRTAAPPQGDGRFNAKQSPFGTDIKKYESITAYTWEDANGDTVKVLVELEGVGKLPKDAVKSHFADRAFELLIDGYNGKKLRFACYKTHGEMEVAECKHVVRANRVNIVIKKAKKDDIWFDLFKKRAIGDDDDP